MDCLLGCDPIIERMLDDDLIIPLVAITGGLLFGMIAVVGGIIGKVSVTRSREATKRELAAYIAEGSLDPDKAIALMNAGKSDFDFDKA